MKTRLTTEQSQHLIDLGVPKEKASKVAWARITDFKGDKIPEKEQMRGVSDKPFSMMHVGFESFSTDDIFALEDFLNGEILPKEIVNEEHEVYNLNMECVTGMCGVNDSLWIASYDRKERSINWFSAHELIDALYQLACWHYGEFKK